MFDDTSLMRMIIEDLSQKHGWTYEDTLDRFYRSKTCKNISNKDTGMFTFAPRELIELFAEELIPHGDMKVAERNIEYKTNR